MRPAVFGEPLRAHPPEIGLGAAPGDARLVDDQHATDCDEKCDGEQHGLDGSRPPRRDCVDRPKSGRSRLCGYAHLRQVRGRQRSRFAFVRGLTRGMIGHAAQAIPGPPAAAALRRPGVPQISGDVSAHGAICDWRCRLRPGGTSEQRVLRPGGRGEALSAVLGRQGGSRGHARPWRFLRRGLPGRAAAAHGNGERRHADGSLANPEARHDSDAA